MTKIQVAVIACRPDYGPEILCYTICCPEEVHILKGLHYEIAKEKATAAGYTPVAAFSERDKAWSDMMKVSTEAVFYRDFYAETLEAMQDAYVDGREMGGADAVEIMGGLISRHLDVKTKQLGLPEGRLHLLLSRKGYWSEREGWVDSPAGAYLTVSARGLDARVKELRATSEDALLMGIPVSLRHRIVHLPCLSVILGAAEAAISRLQHGTPIDSANAAQVMREEIARLSVGEPLLPQAMDGFLRDVLFDVFAEGGKMYPRPPSN